jgi:hypothetical protein
VAIAEVMAAKQALLSKPAAFEGPLLGDILDLGASPDPMCRGRSEQVVDEQALSGRTSALPALVRVDDDPDLPSSGAGPIRVTPIDPPDGPIVLGCGYDEIVGTGAEEPVVFPPASVLCDRAEAGPFELSTEVGVRSESVAHHQVGLFEGSEVHNKTSHNASVPGPERAQQR